MQFRTPLKRQSKTTGFRTVFACLCSLLFLTFVSAGVRADEPGELFPWRAEYRASYNTGIPIGGSAVRELKQLKDGSWFYNFDVSSMFINIQENTVLNWQDNTVIPVSYQYQRSSWLKKRKAQLTFDWQVNKVLNDVQNQPWTMSIPEGTQDKLSYQLQLHMDLIAGKKHMLYSIADGGTLKQMEFAVRGEEMLDTKLGRIATIYVDKVRDADAKRTTRLWFARDYNYLPVRMIQKEEDGQVYEIELVKARVGNRELN